MQDVRIFDGIGWHRTGSAGDSATSQWLVRRLAEVGIDASLQPFAFPKLDVSAAYMVLGDEVIEGHPQYDGGLTGPTGITSTLVAADGDVRGRIAVLASWGLAMGMRELDAVRQGCLRGGAAALVAVSEPVGGMFLANAPSIWDPSTLPQLIVPAAAAKRVLDAARAQAEIRLVIDGTRQPGVATNVVAHIPADQPVSGQPHLLLLTPKSGWFHCAAERGGGLAVWLAAAGAIAATRRRRRDVVLLATSGHELGYFGLVAYLAQHPDLVRDAACCIHLGASIGAAVQPTLVLRASDDEYLTLARQTLQRHDAEPEIVAKPGASVGEASVISALGGRYISLAGRHAYFHTPEDRVSAVLPESLGRYAAAVTELATWLVTH